MAEFPTVHEVITSIHACLVAADIDATYTFATEQVYDGLEAVAPLPGFEFLAKALPKTAKYKTIGVSRLIIKGIDVTNCISITPQMSSGSGWRSRGTGKMLLQLRWGDGTKTFPSKADKSFSYDKAADYLLGVANSRNSQSERRARLAANEPLVEDLASELKFRPYERIIHASSVADLPVAIRLDFGSKCVTTARARELVEGLRALGLISAAKEG